MIAVGITIAFCLLVVAFGLTVFRLLRGPTLPDRVVALDLFGVIALGFLLVLTIRNEDPVILDVAIVIGIVSFMSTVAFATYLERVKS